MGVWQLDPMHTRVEFAVKHRGMMTVRGNFTDVQASGYINVEHPEASSVEVIIQTASIRTHNERRDNDLRTSNILDVENHPTITYKRAKLDCAEDSASAAKSKPPSRASSSRRQKSRLELRARAAHRDQPLAGGPCACER